MVQLVLNSALVLSILFQVAQKQPGAAEYEQFWAAKDADFKDPAKSPLKPADLAKFTKVARYHFNPAFRVNATWEKVNNSLPFGMKTSTAQLVDYQLAGYFVFTLEGQKVRLPGYTSMKHVNHPTYKDRLFIPFTDLSNGKGTYTGGRYIDMPGVTSSAVVLDFNQAYNPYCVYSEKYSCPIPPKECHIPVAIMAGAKASK